MHDYSIAVLVVVSLSSLFGSLLSDVFDMWQMHVANSVGRVIYPWCWFQLDNEDVRHLRRLVRFMTEIAEFAKNRKTLSNTLWSCLPKGTLRFVTTLQYEEGFVPNLEKSVQAFRIIPHVCSNGDLWWRHSMLNGGSGPSSWYMSDDCEVL